ncbi:DUF6318 family protein [Arthrobacter sp. Sr24]
MRRTIVEHYGSRRFVVVLLAACALVLAGCSPPSTVDPTPLPSTAPATSIESSGTAVPPTTEPPIPSPAVYKPATEQGPAENVPVPVLPQKAKEFSKEGLIAFAKYWYSTLGYAFETGDPAPMMAISGPDCRTCQAMEKTTVAGHAAGKWIMGGRMIVDPPSVTFVETPNGTFQAIALVRQEQVKYFRADKTLSKDLGITTATGDILVASYVDGSWLAGTVEHLAGSKGS